MDEIKYFMKNINTTLCIPAAASAKMYNAIGIKTPEIELLSKMDNYEIISTRQKFIASTKNILFTLANDDLDFIKIRQEFIDKYKWNIFCNESLINHFQKFMTPECLEQLQNIFLVDELRTDVDRHTKNYFFYKNKGSAKYEGVVVIDLELMIIYNYCGFSKDDFNNFLYFPYASATPQQSTDKLCYKERAKNLCEIIQCGVLSKNNQQALISALTYDFPEEVNNYCKKQHIYFKNKKKITTPIERLWDYNRNTVGKELGL